jgi:hypothetical protein
MRVGSTLSLDSLYLVNSDEHIIFWKCEKKEKLEQQRVYYDLFQIPLLLFRALV